jgi:hypothetical protein
MIHDTVGEKKTRLVGLVLALADMFGTVSLRSSGMGFTGFTEDFNGNLMGYPQLLAT